MPEDKVRFMESMIHSYTSVHSDHYWDIVSPYLENRGRGRILDIGCGPGLLLKDLNNRYHPQMMYGLDLSDVMLEKAKSVLSEPVKETRIEFIQQHMQKNVSLPQDLDVIFASRVLRSFDNQWEVLNSIYNALKPEGILVMVDWSLESIATYFEWFNLSDDYDTDTAIRRHRNFSRYSIEDWVYLFEKVGFTILKKFRLSKVKIGLIVQK